MTASAIAILAAFLCINLYPEYHGGPQIGRSGLLALSAAMIGMIIFIVYKVVTPLQKESADEPSTTAEPLSSDPNRLKKMFFLWSGFTILLAVSLMRYPLYLYFKDGHPFDSRGIGGLLLGGALIVATVLHIFVRFRDYRKS